MPVESGGEVGRAERVPLATPSERSQARKPIATGVSPLKLAIVGWKYRRVPASAVRWRALLAETSARPVPAKRVHEVPPSVENHQLPRVVSTPTMAMPVGPGAASSRALAPSRSAMLVALARAVTSVPTAPLGAPVSSRGLASTRSTVRSRIGASLAAVTMISPPLSTVGAPPAAGKKP